MRNRRSHWHHFHAIAGCDQTICCHCGRSERPLADAVITTTYRPSSCGPFFPQPIVNNYQPSNEDLTELDTHFASLIPDDYDDPTERYPHRASLHYAEGD